MANKAAAAVKDEYENGSGRRFERTMPVTSGNDLSDAYDKCQ